MKKVIFVCYGNICRSPMAEYICKDFAQKAGYKLVIDSKATSDEEEGSPVHYGTRRILDRLGIDCSAHVAAKLSKKDCDEADYIIGMEDYNLDGIKRIAGEKNYGKIYKLLDFSSRPRDIPDPWYTHDFEATFKDVLEGISGFISYLEKRGEV